MKLLNVKTYIFSNPFNKLGKYPICNGKKHRGIFIGEFCLPLCSRCTAIVLSFVTFYFLLGPPRHIWLYALLLIPTLIDGLLQYGLKLESTNIRRILFGFFCGIGLAQISKLLEGGYTWNLLSVLLR